MANIMIDIREKKIENMELANLTLYKMDKTSRTCSIIPAPRRPAEARGRMMKGSGIQKNRMHIFSSLIKILTEKNA